MKRLIIGSVSGLSILTLSLLLIGSTRHHVVGQPSSQTLKDRAQLEGGRLRIADASYHRLVYNDLPSLIQDSSTIVIGTTRHNRCQLSADGQNITTNYEVVIKEVVKGDVGVGEVITVSTPGGLKVFDKSTSAVVEIPDFRRPLNGRDYVFFLGIDKPRGFFPLVGGFQGAFELPTDGKGVLPSDGRLGAPLRQRFENKGVDLFLKELRHAVTK